MRYPTSLQDKRYPDFIRKSIITKAYPKPDKVFPRIGLKNSEKLVSSLGVSKSVATVMLLKKLSTIPKETPWAYNGHSEEQYTMEEFLDELDGMLCEAQRNPNAFLKDGRMIVSNVYMFYGHLKPNKSRDLITLIKTAQNYSKKHKLGLTAFENFDLTSQSLSLTDICPIKSKGAKVVFSSSGNKGYWDISTMSMRGITSCMKWNGSRQSTSLIGSIIDPYAGVIYLTDGKQTKMGERMIARAVVRLVLDTTDKLALFMEPIYLSNNIKDKPYNDVVCRNVSTIFTSFLQEKTKGVHIIPCQDDQEEGLVIPETEPVQSILRLTNNCDDKDNEFLSYRDSDIMYDNIRKFANPKKIKLKDFSRA